MFNNVLLIGRAVDKPSVKTLESGANVGHLTIAITDQYRSRR